MSENVVVVKARDLWIAGAALLALALSVVVLVITVVVLFRQADDHAVSQAQTAAQARVAVRDNRALCALRAQLKSQVKTSTNYLTKHPDGAPALQLSATSIQQGINKEQATVNALSTIACR